MFPKKLFISLQVTSKLSSKSLCVELENLMPTDKLFLLIISDAAAALVVVAVIVVVAAVVIAAAASKETSMRISGSDKLTFCSKSMFFSEKSKTWPNFRCFSAKRSELQSKKSILD